MFAISTSSPSSVNSGIGAIQVYYLSFPQSPRTVQLQTRTAVHDFDWQPSCAEADVICVATGRKLPDRSQPLSFNHPSFFTIRSSNSITPSHSPQFSRLKTVLLHSLFVPNPASFNRRPHPSSLTQIPLTKPSFWLILLLLLLILGALDLWYATERTLDYQDWGPTRFRVALPTLPDSYHLQEQMRHSPFLTLTALAILPVVSHDPLGLASRWIRPTQSSKLPFISRANINSDVSAIILNWSRPENLIVIVAHLCQTLKILNVLTINSPSSIHPPIITSSPDSWLVSNLPVNTATSKMTTVSLTKLKR
ncbi:hypothetical protein VP01_2625g1 [Puccinia sorghi]|uniref:Uncharacterized protein n=1 Tax=Puccinia sorghi TaxID=27349 RepID=A0A0L6V521_9BASI|nr:hypothetical protein VP01_2625g1 [Puccinia sorghi]